MVDLLIEGTKLEAQSRERRDVLMVCIKWVAVSQSPFHDTCTCEVDSLKDLSRYCANLGAWNLLGTSSEFKSILQLVGLELPSIRALFEIHSHGRGVTAMMPAVIWQTQLTWDRKAPGSYGGAPKATFYNLACEVDFLDLRRGVRSKLGRRTPWPYPTWLL